jgi:hypothetical protein
MHKNEQGLEQRHSSLLSLYEETWEEIRRLREFEWKIAVTFVTLAGGFVVLICSDSFKPLLTHNLRCVLIVVQSLAIIFGIYCLLRTHYYLTEQRNIRRRVEDVLNLHEEGVFTSDALLPVKWKGKKVRFGFQAFGLLIPLMLTVFFVQTLAIYITWVASIEPTRDLRHPGRCLSEVTPK